MPIAILLTLLSAVTLLVHLHERVPPPPARQSAPLSLCIAEADGVLEGWACTGDDAATWRFRASARARAARGEPICWWTAPWDAFEAIPGVGTQLALRLVALRDAGGVPTPAGLASVRGVGPALRSRIGAGVTLACAP